MSLTVLACVPAENVTITVMAKSFLAVCWVPSAPEEHDTEKMFVLLNNYTVLAYGRNWLSLALKTWNCCV